METRIAQTEQWTLLREAGRSVDGSQEKGLYSFESFSKAGFHRSSNLYQPRYPIAPNEGDIKTYAAKETVSKIQVFCNGHEIIIYLFDPSRSICNGGGIKEFDLFCGVGKRIGPYMDDSEAVERVTRLGAVRTTRELFLEYLEYWNNSGNWDTLATCELHFSRGVLVEYSGTLSVIEDTLDLIDKEMVDNKRLQENIEVWRSLLSPCRLVLADMSNSIKHTRQMLTSMQKGYALYFAGSCFTEELDRTESSLNELTEYMVEVKGRVEKTFQALMSSMSILANQEAISEAASVGKLTELAFLFIPTSFAATFYSMQIESLKPSVAKFAVLALVLSTVAYGARLFIISSIPRYIEAKIKGPLFTDDTLLVPENITPLTYIHFYWKVFVAKSLYYHNSKSQLLS
ncbi:hypothetical protein H072_5629 [Dactylellina haptotyla CBS 200.50]|uniref:Uncharacterized protein n=1 Tax=Dactylellina haptotyla (strain CBS 200.50) TaxID=1284197 RepID=S8AH56_DACHA|nr:hypothetical protein H072_5629 [Dactylellina haptotyla CBS 200.50]